MWIFASLMFVLVVGCAVLPMRIHKAWKIAIAILVAAAAFKFQLTALVGGPMFFAPQLPRWIQLSFAWCYAIVFLLFFLLLISECIQLIFRISRHKVSNSIHNKVNFALFVTSVFLASLGIIQGTALPSVREVSLEFKNLPQEAKGMKIAVLADLHADGVTRADKIRAIVERTNALKPDMIVIVGDFVDGSVEQRGEDLQSLRELSAPYGVFGVPGNHEYYSGYTDWMKFLPTLGIRMLLNENVKISNGIVLSGVTDPAAARMNEVVPNIPKALSGTSAESFVILLSHQPVLANDAAKQGVSLQFSGHTHGGMIWGIDQIVARFNGGFVSGLYQVDDMKLYVSNGSGIWNGFPIRIGRNSEITLIQLLPSN